MSKNNNKNINQNITQNKHKKQLPIVSICTPTFNRRPFIPFLIKCFENQTYPKDRIEWIIIDDGTDCIEDLVKHIPQVKYFHYKEQMLLGAKRNLMHSKCSGDIIVYMDDDDYYPPERVSHAVDTLILNPNFLIVGSSEMHIYFPNLNKIYQAGPYSPNHSTAATFAFRKELLQKTEYSNEKALAEERDFLKNYTIPLKQLDTLKTILVFSHIHNSFDKNKMLENPTQCKIIPSKYLMEDFIKNDELIDFYKNKMNVLLETYECGKPSNKPHVLTQIEKLTHERTIIEEHKKMMNQTLVQNKILNDFNVMKYEKQLADKNYLINELLKKVKNLTEELNSEKNK